MWRWASNILFAVAFLILFRPGLSLGQSAEQAVSFQWLASSGETTGIKYPTHQLQPLSLRAEGGPPVEIEQEEVKVDARTTRVTRRVFISSVNGERQLSETVVEEIRNMPGDRVQAVRTTSRRDINGRFSPIQREVQEMAPAGADSYRINKSLFLPGNSGDLVEKERVQQTERSKAGNSVEIDRIRYMQGPGGSWSAAERRVSQNSGGKEQNRAEEQVYDYDLNGRSALKQQLTVKEWKDSAGRHRQSDSYVPGPEGKLQLNSRVTLLQKPTAGGGQETTEIHEEVSPAVSGEGLKRVRRVVENLQVREGGKTERQLEVQEPDLNGKWRSIQSQASTEVR